MALNDTTDAIIGAAIEVHRILGPGLLESVYEEALCRELALRKIPFERQKCVPIRYKGVSLLTDLRLDLLVNDDVIVELKAKEKLSESDKPQLLSYLRICDKRVGLIINFCHPKLVDGVHRVVNDFREGADEKFGEML